MFATSIRSGISNAMLPLPPRPDKTTGHERESSFPAGTSQCLLSLVMFHSVFSSLWYFTVSSFPAAVHESSLPAAAAAS